MTTQPNAAQAERLDVYAVEGEGKAFWTKIGAAWAHNDGEGFTVQLVAYPVSGRLTIRKPKPKASNKSEAR